MQSIIQDPNVQTLDVVTYSDLSLKKISAENSVHWKKCLSNEHEFDSIVVPGDVNCFPNALCDYSCFQNVFKCHQKLKNHVVIDAYLLREFISDTYQKAPKYSFYHELLNVHVPWVAVDERNDATEVIIRRIRVEVA